MHPSVNSAPVGHNANVPFITSRRNFDQLMQPTSFVHDAESNQASKPKMILPMANLSDFNQTSWNQSIYCSRNFDSTWKPATESHPEDFASVLPAQPTFQFPPIDRARRKPDSWPPFHVSHMLDYASQNLPWLSKNCTHCGCPQCMKIPRYRVPLSFPARPFGPTRMPSPAFYPFKPSPIELLSSSMRIAGSTQSSLCDLGKIKQRPLDSFQSMCDQYLSIQPSECLSKAEVVCDTSAEEVLGFNHRGRKRCPSEAALHNTDLPDPIPSISQAHTLHSRHGISRGLLPEKVACADWTVLRLPSKDEILQPELDLQPDPQPVTYSKANPAFIPTPLELLVEAACTVQSEPYSNTGGETKLSCHPFMRRTRCRKSTHPQRALE